MEYALKMITVICLLIIASVSIRALSAPPLKPEHEEEGDVEEDPASLRMREQAQTLKQEYLRIRLILDNQAPVLPHRVEPLLPLPRDPRISADREVWDIRPHRLYHDSGELFRSFRSPLLQNLTNDFIMDKQNRTRTK